MAEMSINLQLPSTNICPLIANKYFLNASSFVFFFELMSFYRRGNIAFYVNH